MKFLPPKTGLTAPVVKYPVTSWRAGSHEDNVHHTVTQNYVLDVTSTSNVKFYFETDSFSGNTELRGDANNGESNVTIIRLGDT